MEQETQRSDHNCAASILLAWAYPGNPKLSTEIPAAIELHDPSTVVLQAAGGPVDVTTSSGCVRVFVAGAVTHVGILAVIQWHCFQL